MYETARYIYAQTYSTIFCTCLAASIYDLSVRLVCLCIVGGYIGIAIAYLLDRQKEKKFEDIELKEALQKFKNGERFIHIQRDALWACWACKFRR